jgi:hypothetical protein
MLASISPLTTVEFGPPTDRMLHSTRRFTSKPGRWFIALLACVQWIAYPLAAHSAAADEEFRVQSATVADAQGVLLLNAQLQFVLPEGARQAVREGVALTMDVEIELKHNRNWWLDDTTATLVQRYEVSYHALSQHFLLRNLNSDRQTAHATLDAALESLAQIRDLPLLDRALIDPREQYRLRMRAALDVRTLPDTLRLLLFWADNWRQRTDWYTWPLAL